MKFLWDESCKSTTSVLKEDCNWSAYQIIKEQLLGGLLGLKIDKPVGVVLTYMENWHDKKSIMQTPWRQKHRT